MHRLHPLAFALAVLLAVLTPVGLAFWTLRQNAQQRDLDRFEAALKAADVSLQREVSQSGAEQEAIRRAFAEVGAGVLELRFLSAGEVAPPNAAFRRTLKTDRWGEPASFTVTAGPRFWRESQQVLASIVFGAGSVAAVVLAMLGWALARQRVELAADIVERTAELKAANAQLTVAVAREQELNAMKTNFISMVSHELRTPMQVIQTSAELLDRYRERLTAEQRAEHFSAISSSVDRVAKLTEEVLLFSRFEANRIALNLEPLDLVSWVRTLVDELRTATAARCPVEVTCAVTDPIQTDERLLRHILGNLLGNGVKYSPAGSPVTLRVEREGNDVSFVVTDRGLGIPAADQARLFVSFHRGENARHISGTGLGLAIVKRCVDLHGGRITLTSEPDQGTTVSVWLPLLPASIPL